MSIQTRPEADKEAQSIIRALKTMPESAEERESYLESLKALNEEFTLGLAEEIQKLEVGTEESAAEELSAGSERITLPGNELEIKNKAGDDDKMAKTDYLTKARNLLNKNLFGGLKVSHLVALVLGAIIVFALLPRGGVDTTDLDKQISDLTKENTRLQTGWTAANVTISKGSADGAPCEYNSTTEEAAVNAATQELQKELEDCQNASGAEVGVFTDEETKEWVSSKLSLQKTAVNTFVPFESKDEALEFVKEVYTYNSAHNLAWNNKEANFAIADAHKSDRDDVKMLFSAKNNDLYAVIPSESNFVIPTIFKFVEEDNNYALEEYDGSDVAVVAMDKLKKPSSNND